MKHLCHLHVHTDASVQDGMGTVQRLVKSASEKGLQYLAMTDHGTLANSISFMMACNTYGVKPILGQEIYINHANKVGHLTLIASTHEGFNNLIRLTNKVHRFSTTRKPSATLQDLAEFSKDLICLSGCMASPIHWLDIKASLEFAFNLKQIYKKNFYAETMLIGGDIATHTRALKIAKRLNLKTVLTNDVHFPDKGDAEVHYILTQMKMKMSYSSNQLWLKTPKELLTFGSQFDDADNISKWMDETYSIAESIEQFSLKHSPSLPAVEDVEEKLFQQVKLALSQFVKGKNAQVKKQYVERVMMELKVMQELKFLPYFFILNDIVSFAKKNDICIGPGRGSGAASLVLFLLGITKVDPLYYGLSFERFINKGRSGYPDVDIDFEVDGREKVLQYAQSHWNAVPIATYARYSHKVLTHDLCKFLNLPRDVDEKASDKGPNSEEFKQLCDSSSLFLKAYNAFIGQIRHKGKHAGGVVITDQLVPIEKIGDALLAAWIEGVNYKELSYAGIVKFDLLGLAAVSALKELKTATHDDPAEPGNDEKTFKLFRKGDLIGIFQFSGSQGIHDVTKRLKPSTFEDLAAINALYRPGTIASGMTEKYPEWKLNPRKLHPKLDPILESTYGAIVFQEQVMKLYSTITGGDLVDGDKARTIIVRGPKPGFDWEGEVAKMKLKFITEGSKAFNKKFLVTLWDEIIKFAGYSFNKAHAIAYAMIAWQMAWYKAHHRAYFYSTMMKWDQMNFQTYLFEAVKYGIKIKPPHINISTNEFEVHQNEIYLPLKTVKFMGDKGSTSIIEERKSHGIFKSFAEIDARLKKREFSSRARQGLYAIGGMNSLRGKPEDISLDESLKVESKSDQIRYLGVFIPDAEFIRLVETHDDSTIVGVVNSSKRKESRYGIYYVYRLSPSGSFWIRGEKQLEDGEVVSVKISKNSGKAIEVERLHI